MFSQTATTQNTHAHIHHIRIFIFALWFWRTREWKLMVDAASTASMPHSIDVYFITEITKSQFALGMCVCNWFFLLVPSLLSASFFFQHCCASMRASSSPLSCTHSHTSFDIYYTQSAEILCTVRYDVRVFFSLSVYFTFNGFLVDDCSGNDGSRDYWKMY